MHAGKLTLLSNFQTEDFAKVERQCLAILEKNPRDYLTLLLIAEAIWRAGDYDRAVPYALRALELDPGSFRALCIVARSYAEKGNHDKAREFANRILATRPTRSPHHAIRAVLLPLAWLPRIRRIRQNSADQLQYFDDFETWVAEYVRSSS
ncbi:MAG: tetratricopeptide repeat protein [Burkholderiales bacterium]